MQASESQPDLTNQEVYTKLKGFIKEVTDQIRADFSTKFSELTTKLQNAESTITILKEENKVLKKQQKQFSREVKRNNILIFGIDELENEDLYNITKQFIKTNLNVNIENSEIDHIYRFGASRSIVVKLLSFHKKIEILKNGYLLKETEYSITSDLIKEDREEQKLLRKYHKEAKIQGKDSKIKHNKLIINNTTYSIYDLKNIETQNSKEIGNLESQETKTQTKTDTSTNAIFKPGPSNSKSKTFHRSDASSAIASNTTSTTQTATKQTRSKTQKS